MRACKMKHIISFFLCMMLLISGIVPVNAAWDGYVEKEGEAERILVNVSNLSTIFNAGGIPSSKYVKGEKFSANWKNHSKTPNLKFNSVERDWSDCGKLSFDIYSEKSVNSKIMLIVYADHVPTPGTTVSYFSYTIPLNFVGWKHFELGVDEFENTNFADWAKITRVNFVAEGWGLVPNDEANLYITSVKGILGEEFGFADLVSMEISEENRKKVFSTVNKGIAVMPFAANAVKGGEVVFLDIEDRVTTIAGENAATLSFFENILGAQTSREGNKIEITLDSKTVKLEAGSAKYSTSGKTGELKAPVTERDGKVYVPICTVLNLLGKECGETDSITLIGDKNIAGEVEKSPVIGQSLKIMLNVKDSGKQTYTKADWKQLKDKWRKYLVGDETKDLNNEWIKTALAQVDKNCEVSMSSMNKGGDILALFGTVPCTESGNMTTQYAKLYYMAEAYGTYGSKYYKNEELKKDILYGIEWMYENLYGQDEIDGTGWRSIADYNWWDWMCGTPLHLTNTLLIMEDSLTPAQIEKYLSLYEHVRTTMRMKATPDHAASRMNAGIASGALMESEERMTSAVEDYNLMLLDVEKGNGVQEDGLYICHDYFAYTTEYGTATLLDRLSKVQAICSGTAFEFATPYKYNSCEWMYETFAPIMFNGYMTSAQSGRAKDKDEEHFTRYAIGAMIDFIGAFGIDDDIKLKQLIKRNVTDQTSSTIRSGLSVDQIAKLSEILADTTIHDEPYLKNKIYYTGDSVMHQRDDFGFALQMSSTRIAAWESINANNMSGWYQSDGMLYTYVDTDPQSYGKAFWANGNPYHLPGTTVDTQKRVATSIKNSAEVLTQQDFVGAAGYGDLYATAAMQLESYHNDNENAVTSTADHGGDAPYHKSTLMAKKAYFMFDDEVVALGSDINADDGFEVQTIIENRKLNKTEVIQSVDASADSKAPYNVISVKSSANDGNVVENTLDNDYSTRWSAEGDAWAVYELEAPSPVGYVGISQFGGTGGKQAIFELETSLDGINWTKVWEGMASGTTESMEAYDMKGTVAKYVRYSGHGRTNSQWNSITEFEIFRPQPDGSMPVDGKVSSNKIEGTENITVDGTLLEKVSNYTKTFNNPSWMHLENVGGYFLPNGGKLVLDKVTNKNNFIEMWLTHGVSPKKGSYAYVILPKKTAEETDVYSKNPDIEILSNTEKLQAVKEKKLGITGMIFWKEGVFENITVSKPMIVMAGEENGTYNVNISDPTQLLTEATVTIDGEYELLKADDRCTVSVKDGKTLITVDFTGSKGRTLPVKLKKN